MTAASLGPYIIIFALVPLLFVIFFNYALAGSREHEAEQVSLKRRIERLEQGSAESKMPCPHCNAMNPETAKYCNECGVTLH